MNNKPIKYTIRHRIRLLIGIHGEIPNYGYCFGNFNWLSFKNQTKVYEWMFRYGNVILNKIIGYRESDWKK